MDPKQGKIVVTGGAGFIGAQLVRLLHEEGVPVTVFDSLIHGTRESVPEGVPLVVGDIRDTEALAQAFEGATSVVHLAALISVPDSIQHPEETYDVNVVGTQNVFAAAQAAGVKRVVYASSASVYGNEPTLPKRETSVLDPQSPYAASKIQNEQDASASGIPSIGLRFFNIYGPGQEGTHPYASVLARWKEALAKGTPIQVFGDGEQTRDFIHVRDIAQALRMALGAPVSGAHIYNVASGTQVSLRALRGLISEVLGTPVEWVQHPERAGDIRYSYADVSAIATDLGFVPAISLSEGVRELFA